MSPLALYLLPERRQKAMWGISLPFVAAMALEDMVVDTAWCGSVVEGVQGSARPDDLPPIGLTNAPATFCTLMNQS